MIAIEKNRPGTEASAESSVLPTQLESLMNIFITTSSSCSCGLQPTTNTATYGGPEGHSLVVFATWSSALEPSLVEPSLVELR